MLLTKNLDANPSHPLKFLYRPRVVNNLSQRLFFQTLKILYGAYILTFTFSSFSLTINFYTATGLPTRLDRDGFQSLFRQSEKLASIGQLAAGVAHEINNPIGFNSSNIATLQKYVFVNASPAIESKETITISSGCEGNNVWLRISDTGTGIPEDIIPRMFEPFFTTKPVGTGTGLGLSLSYGIIEKHGGKIEVESQVGKGTTFTVWLSINQSIEEQSA